jgi:exonuclease SbcC
MQLATGAVATARQRLELAQASQVRVAELEAERQGHADALSDWTRLGEDLGRNGLQAAEIDAAGPELTAITNDLLHSCLGPRFTVEIQTTRLDSKGKKELEALPIICLNSERGYEGDVRTLSGGERALVGEALQLGLTVLVCGRRGMDQEITLIRDEPTAALEPSDADIYLGSMRMAAAIVHARQVVVISHNPRVAELSDVRLQVAGGAISIEQ